MHEITSDELQHQCEIIEERNEVLHDVHSVGVDENIATIQAEITRPIEIDTHHGQFPFDLGYWTDAGFVRPHPDGTIEFNISKEELYE